VVVQVDKKTVQKQKVVVVVVVVQVRLVALQLSLHLQSQLVRLVLYKQMVELVVPVATDTIQHHIIQVTVVVVVVVLVVVVVHYSYFMEHLLIQEHLKQVVVPVVPVAKQVGWNKMRLMGQQETPETPE
jgi:hypothetical protein